jgi:hypothetical protein
MVSVFGQTYCKLKLQAQNWSISLQSFYRLKINKFLSSIEPFGNIWYRVLNYLGLFIQLFILGELMLGMVVVLPVAILMIAGIIYGVIKLIKRTRY